MYDIKPTISNKPHESDLLVYVLDRGLCCYYDGTDSSLRNVVRVLLGVPLVSFPGLFVTPLIIGFTPWPLVSVIEITIPAPPPS